MMCFCSLGLLWQLRPSDVEVELLAHTRNVISKDLEEETGLHTGWIQNGGLFIASNKQRLDEYKRLMSVRIKIVCFLTIKRKSVTNSEAGGHNNAAARMEEAISGSLLQSRSQKPGRLISGQKYKITRQNSEI